MIDSQIVRVDVHPRGRLAFTTGLLFVAGALLLYDMSNSNKVHELGSLPYVAALCMGAVVVNFLIARSLAPGDATRRYAGWRTLAWILLVISSAATLFAMILLYDWIAAT